MSVALRKELSAGGVPFNRYPDMKLAAPTMQWDAVKSLIGVRKDQLISTKPWINTGAVRTCFAVNLVRLRASFMRVATSLQALWAVRHSCSRHLHACHEAEPLHFTKRSRYMPRSEAVADGFKVPTKAR